MIAVSHIIALTLARPAAVSHSIIPAIPPIPMAWALIFQRRFISMATNTATAAPQKKLRSHSGAWSMPR